MKKLAQTGYSGQIDSYAYWSQELSDPVILLNIHKLAAQDYVFELTVPVNTHIILYIKNF